jgi:hypothetical protein
MVRTINIDIWSGDWYMETDIEGNDKDYDFPMFANYNVVDGKITHLHDFMLTERTLVRARNHGKEFLEVCNFVYVPREKGELVESKKQEFTGDFIDAMIFIQKILEKDGYGEKTS